MHALFKRIPAIAFFLASLLTSPTVFAQTFDEAIAGMAENIAGYLGEKGQKQIMIGDFDGPGAATAGRAIRARLESELKKKEIAVLPLGSNWKVRGSFSFESRDSFSIVLIKADLIDKSGKEISGFREKVKVEEVDSLEDISRLLGLTVDLRDELGEGESADSKSAEKNASTEKSATAANEKETASVDAGEKLVSVEKEVAEKVSASVAEPKFTFVNATKSQFAAESSSPFRMEILVRPEGAESFKPVAIEDAGGFPFAPLAARDNYKIRIYNNADHAIGVKLSVDGINSFALSEEPAFRNLGTWYVGPKREGVIGGWYINARLLKGFLVTASGENLGLPDATDMGTVTAQFFHAWSESDPTPPIEAFAAKGQLRTVAGPDIARDQGFVRTVFGKRLLGSLSLRYSNPDDLPPE